MNWETHSKTGRQTWSNSYYVSHNNRHFTRDELVFKGMLINPVSEYFLRSFSLPDGHKMEYTTYSLTASKYYFE